MILTQLITRAYKDSLTLAYPSNIDIWQVLQFRYPRVSSWIPLLILIIDTMGSLKTPDQSCTDRQVWWVHFSGPPHFGPFATFFGFFLLNLGSTAPNYPRRPPMRSSKAPPNQKNRGQVLPTPPNLASEPDKCNARWGFLGTP